EPLELLAHHQDAAYFSSPLSNNRRRSSNGQRSKRPSNGPSTPSTPIDEDALAALEGRRKEYGESPELELQA
ncbi:11665_t:CDS:2, partial [Rhizophagus irregularis]